MTHTYVGVLSCAAFLALAAPARAVDGRGDTSRADQCEITVDLMAVVYDHRAPERSIAMVVHGKNPGRVVRVGSRVAGLPVLAVLPEALWLGTPEAPCWIPLDHQGRQRAAPRSKPKPRSKPRKGKR
jgi:hypothetical protein